MKRTCELCQFTGDLDDFDLNGNYDRVCPKCWTTLPSNDVAREVLRNMKRLVDDLKSSKPIEVTEVRREHTPDGPLTTRRKKFL